VVVTLIESARWLSSVRVIGEERGGCFMPSFEDPMKGPRPSQRAVTLGYPFGFAKSQWLLRDRLLVRMWQATNHCDDHESMEAALAHEAVVRALDWERLLGSFNHAGEDRFPVATLDTVACNLLAWLDYQRFWVVRHGPKPEEPLPMVASRLPMVFDNARKIVVVVTDQEAPDVHQR
jgi:hypothetical protein